MSNGKYKNYILEVVALLKKQAKQAKLDADNSNKGQESYKNGYLMAYHIIIEFMKNGAFSLDIDQRELGLADIEPERDLL